MYIILSNFGQVGVFMQYEVATYAVRFKNGKFYNQPEGIKTFESYEIAKKFLKNKNIIEDFDLIDNKEIVCQLKEKNKHNYLCLIWSTSKEIIWERQI